MLRLKSGICHYRGKVVKSGNIIEVYQYEKGVFTGGGVSMGIGRAGNGNITEEQKKKNRELVLMRARRDLRRIINANINQYGVSSKFVTLTFRDNVENIEFANNEFRQFIKRLNYKVYGQKCSKIKYSAVVEFQKRGAVHYHVIFYNLEYIEAKDLESVWGNGFVKINKIDDVDNVGAYVCKYMAKDANDNRLIGKKMYFNSRGLIKPQEQYIDDEDIENLRKSLPYECLTYKQEFSNDYMGYIEYEQYNLLKK